MRRTVNLMQMSENFGAVYFFQEKKNARNKKNCCVTIDNFVQCKNVEHLHD